jgi:hypothetical protein
MNNLGMVVFLYYYVVVFPHVFWQSVTIQNAILLAEEIIENNLTRKIRFWALLFISQTALWDL